MSALLELQRELQAHVLRGDEAALRAVVATPRADAAQRLGIYSHAYRVRLLGVLRDDFPGLRALAGDEDFEALALAYVESTPSAHANVRWYGGGLADFARARAPWSAQPEFAAMAALEWAIGLAFDAADDPIVEFAEVAALAPADWPRLRLKLHASLQRLELEHDVDAIRRAVDRSEPIPSAAALTPARPWLAWRQDSIVRHRRLEDDEAAALDAVAQGASFAELCVRLCDWHAPDAVAVRAAGLFRRWIEEQWVSTLSVRPA